MARIQFAAVIPALNRAATLGRAIESARSQLRPPDEIIVVDDGSTDDTAAVAESYGVRVICKSHGGVGSARNVGVLSATSAFIAFLDSDDFWYPEHLATMERAIDATREQALIYFANLAFARSHGGETAWGAAGFSIAGAHELVEDGSSWLLLPHQPMFIPASVVRRDAYLSVGGSKEELICRSDTDLFFRLGLGEPICAVEGLAGEATLDDPNSVTQRFASNDLTYLACTVSLYDGLMHRPNVSEATRKAFKRRLADARWTLARHTYGRRPFSAAVHATAATRLDPSISVRRSLALIRRRLHERTTRDTLSPRGRSSGLEDMP